MMRMSRVPVVVFALLGLVGCSSGPAPDTHRVSGSIPAGTAQVTIDDRGTTTSNIVDCQTNQSLTQLRIASPQERVTVLVDNSKSLTAKGITIAGVSQFTGSYWQDVQGSATAEFVDQTYTFTGRAAGFFAADPARRVEQSFVVRAAC